MAHSIYPIVEKVLANATARLSAREVFNRLHIPDVTTHDVSKALNNLKAMGRVGSVKAPDLGHCAHRWFLVKKTDPAAATTPFRFTPSGALTIQTDTVVVMLPPRIVGQLRGFLATDPAAPLSNSAQPSDTPAKPVRGRRRSGKIHHSFNAGRRG